jgi:hypothetical protein
MTHGDERDELDLEADLSSDPGAKEQAEGGRSPGDSVGSPGGGTSDPAAKTQPAEGGRDEVDE